MTGTFSADPRYLMKLGFYNGQRQARFLKGSAAMSVYSQCLSGDNTREVDRLKRNLFRAMREEITPRQRQLLLLYYNEGLTMQEIADRFMIDKSTVSRTIKRGEARLQRCLRYGASSYLRELDRAQ